MIFGALLIALISATGAPLAAQVPDQFTDAASDLTVPPTDQPADPLGPDAARDGACDLFTIARGSHSGFGADAPGFAGADLVIRDPHAWAGFWRAHTSNRDRPSEPPPVDFRRYIVLASIQGPQNSGGGPNITIAFVHSDGPLVSVGVVDDPRPGPLDEITNPFHIVTINRRCVAGDRSAAFIHIRPQHGTGVVQGRVFAARDDGGEAPLPNSIVTLLTPDGAVGRARSGLDGSYYFLNIAPAAYGLLAAHRGFAPEDAGIEVTENSVTNQVFVLHRQTTGALVGRVLGVTDPSQRPVPIGGALVRVMQGDHIAAETHSNDRGYYAIRELPPGEYRATAQARGWQPGRAVVEIAAGERTRQIFELEPR